MSKRTPRPGSLGISETTFEGLREAMVSPRYATPANPFGPPSAQSQAVAARNATGPTPLGTNPPPMEEYDQEDYEDDDASGREDGGDMPGGDDQRDQGGPGGALGGVTDAEGRPGEENFAGSSGDQGGRLDGRGAVAPGGVERGWGGAVPAGGDPHQGDDQDKLSQQVVAVMHAAQDRNLKLVAQGILNRAHADISQLAAVAFSTEDDDLAVYLRSIAKRVKEAMR